MDPSRSAASEEYADGPSCTTRDVLQVRPPSLLCRTIIRVRVMAAGLENSNRFPEAIMLAALSRMFGKRFVLTLQPDAFRLIMDGIMLAAGLSMLWNAANAD